MSTMQKEILNSAKAFGKEQSLRNELGLKTINDIRHASEMSMKTPRVNDLQRLTQNVDLGDMTRRHQIAMNGHMGHARNLSQSIHIIEERVRDAGWGHDKEILNQTKDVRCLPVEQQYHKKFWDHEATQIHMKTTGLFSNHVDQQMGLSFDDLEGLSVRQQREIVKRRAVEMNKIKNLKFKNHVRGQGASMLNDRLA